MTNRYMKNDNNLPLWAALGAPLIGVPLMVGLLAITAPKADAAVEESVPTLVSEPVDSHVVTPASGDSALELATELGA